MIVFRLAEIATEKGFDKSKLHRAADVSYPTVLRLWNSKDVKQFDTLVIDKLCDVLNCEPCDLITRQPSN
jgi:DNA-binding Xre family transcriptional regulator